MRTTTPLALLLTFPLAAACGGGELVSPIPNDAPPDVSPDAGQDSGGNDGGSDAGTQAECPTAVVAPELVKDIRAPGGSYPVRLFAHGCTAYFNAGEGYKDWELWRTDGTNAGTVRVFSASPFYYDLPHAVGDVVVFQHYDRPWRTDGTEAGTFSLMDGWALPNYFRDAAAIGATLIFNARDAMEAGPLVDSQYGIEPWITDGTKAGTKLLMDTLPGPEPVIGGPVGFSTAGGKVYFWLEGNSTNGAFWQTDGTTAGTKKVHDVALTRARISGAPPDAGAAVIGEKLFFLGSSGAQFGLWTSDGTPSGTILLRQLDVPPNGGASMYSPNDKFAMAELGGKLYLYASTRGIHFEGQSMYFGPPIDALWVSDGTVAGTQLVVEIGHQQYTDDYNIQVQLVAAGNLLYFFSLDEPGGPIQGKPALFGSDGTAAGTLQLDSFDQVGDLVPMAGAVHFWGRTAPHGAEVFRSGGTVATTSVLKDIHPGPNDSGWSDLTVIDGRLYLTADDGTHGAEPWTSDGTEAGTAMVSDIHPGSGSSNPAGFTKLGSVILFSADNGVHGVELWKM